MLQLAYVSVETPSTFEQMGKKSISNRESFCMRPSVSLDAFDGCLDSLLKSLWSELADRIQSVGQ